jgi:23S rRNA pseudouridine2605 synthase
MSEPAGETTGIRLQKVLAQAGLGSRRACERLIEQGRVEVDGRRVVEQGKRVDPDRQVIKVDGMRVVTAADRIYLALNKPRGVVSTMSDPTGRPSLAEYVQGKAERLFHVGRLDTDTEGLILLTNDGELANRLAHPRYEVPKTYLAELAGPLPKDLGKRLRTGVELDDGIARVDSFRVIGGSGNRLMVELVLHEGRNRIVRRMLEAAGHPVRHLVRTKIGPITLGDLRSGRTRALNRVEVGELFAAAGL